MRALLVAIALVWSASPADACAVGPRSIFRVFDEAETVALVHAYTVKRTTILHVIQTFKGKPGRTIVLDVQQQTMCSPDLHGIGVIFLPKERAFFALNAEAFWKQPFVDAVSAYAAAKTATARASVLVDFVNSRDAILPFYATDALAEDPEALVALTADDRERLLRLLPGSRPPSMLPVVLARLGVDAKQLDDDAAVIAKNRVFETITDTNKLADIIAAAPKTGSPRAAAAFERCERLRGKRLGSFPGIVALYTMGHDWKRLADACRNQK